MQVADHRTAGFIFKINAVEGDGSLYLLKSYGVGRYGQHFFGLKQLKNPLRRCQGRLHNGVFLRKLPNGLKEQPHVGNERGEDAKRHVLPEDFAASVPDDQRHGKGAHHFYQWNKNAENVYLLKGGSIVGVIQIHESVMGVLFPQEHLKDGNP